MIIIPIKSINLFKQRAAKIANKRIMPICEYIRIQFTDGTCTLTKTNMNAFVREDFDAEGKGEHEFLILEIDLFAFASHSSSEFLTIKRKSKDLITLQDDISSALCRTTVDPFTELEIPDEPSLELTPKMISSIRTASKMIAVEEIATWRSYVFVGLNMIIGCDGMIAYSCPCDIEEKIIFRKEAISVLSDIGVSYKQNKSYDFFESGRLMYGFAKTEQGFFDMTKPMVIPDSEKFEIPKHEIVAFNEWILGIASKPEFATVYWKPQTGSLGLFGQTDYDEKEIERTLKSVSGPEFKYLPMNMNKLLKGIDTSMLTCYRGEKNICITDESKSFISLIQQIV